ncbi:ATP-dependent DNA helicase RecG [Acidimicrobiia bacterium EGI L10123]|uniref:ATP-dependent DNA helicase RecG n=1 Tax=Salinilacustrithrix flava TaxID=2957203 RepID=UPI003D7C2913|nr:ATP-dependent DNA helicase RecG [Acidimicrobiia bacterium EGI L10123]
MARTLRFLSGIPVSELKGVGPARAKALASVGIETVFDLLTHYPRRYIDRTKEARIADLHVGEVASVLARVDRISSRRLGGGRGRGGRVMVEASVSDSSGRMKITFFNQAWREQQLTPGTEAVFWGKLEDFRGTKQLTNPVVDLVGDQTGQVVPVYPQSEKARITTQDVRRWVDEALRRAGDLVDPVPEPLLDRLDLVDRTAAMRMVHAPGDSVGAYVVARKRLIFDELLRLQLALVLRKRQVERTTVGVTHELAGALVGRFHDALPYPLTGAQRRVIAEIEADLADPVPMHRLLQGDVGAGKTVVAVSAMLVAVQGGHQGALMAPTEVLAEQHALGIRELLADLRVGDEGALFDRPLRVELLTNRVPAGERRKITEGLAAGEVDIAIGTHALLSADVDFASLGVVVVDEQHRFGVEQRAALRDKGRGTVPDVLVMTATPIPRTAAMTVYGDLDVSVLDELPPGRTPIETTWARTEAEQAQVWEQVRAEVAAGRQAYVVSPLVEESEKLEVSSATETYEQLSHGELAGLRLGLLHGRVPPAEKEATMRQFREGRLDVLVATTVIEVGVDVPNATVMVVLDADRFGIAQLHQLRGRVGRGAHRSYCHLLGEGATDDGERRLEAMVETTDGFVLAEVDLDLRGEGTILGARQKGRNDLKLASLRDDREVVDTARAIAFELVDAPGGPPDALVDEVRLFLDEDEEAFLFKS